HLAHHRQRLARAKILHLGTFDALVSLAAPQSRYMQRSAHDSLSMAPFCHAPESQSSPRYRARPYALEPAKLLECACLFLDFGFWVLGVFLGFGIWDLEFVCDLDFGFWNFRLSVFSGAFSFEVTRRCDLEFGILFVFWILGFFWGLDFGICDLFGIWNLRLAVF